MNIIIASRSEPVPKAQIMVVKQKQIVRSMQCTEQSRWNAFGHHLPIDRPGRRYQFFWFSAPELV